MKVYIKIAGLDLEVNGTHVEDAKGDYFELDSIFLHLDGQRLAFDKELDELDYFTLGKGKDLYTILNEKIMEKINNGETF